MNKLIVIATLALFASATCEPVVYAYPPYVAAAPYASIVAAPEVIAPPAAVAPAPLPLSSVSAYSYGSSYSVQDYLLNAGLAAPVAAYTLPYAYAADYYYRK